LTGSFYDEDKMLPLHKEAGDRGALALLFLCSLYLNYIFENYNNALEAGKSLKVYIDSVASSPCVPLFNFYDSLTRLALFSGQNKLQQEKSLKAVKKNQKKMVKWAYHAPMNYKHKYHLVEAETARIQGQEGRAREHYDLAVKLARENKFTHEEALSLELTAKFRLGLQEEKIAALYMIEAYNTYRMWGANTKVKHIEDKYRALLKLNAAGTSLGLSLKRDTSSITASSEAMDLSTVIKTSQALSGKIELSKLLEAIINSAIENAGAQRGFLIIENENNNLCIEAEAEIGKTIKILESFPVEKGNTLCSTIINYVNRTGEIVVLNNAYKDGSFTNDPYIAKNEIKSLLCMPIIYKGKNSGILYLENNLSTNCFTDERIELLSILSSQAAISIENARLYEKLEEKVAERTIQLNEANRKLTKLALSDPLTSLHNRRYVYEFVSELSKNFIKNQVKLLNSEDKRDLKLKNKVLGLYLIDIDHFKNVNDSYGHKSGDIVLVNISKRLEKLIRSDDVIVRWGGEEFLIILMNTKPEYLKVFSKKVLDNLRNKEIKISNNKMIHITCSLGCAKLPLIQNHPDSLSLEQTIDLCDYALYIAKENGRNQAIHIESKYQRNINDNVKEYLSKLSKEIEVNNDYIDIDYIM
jgi:histidine kinase